LCVGQERVFEQIKLHTTGIYEHL